MWSNSQIQLVPLLLVCLLSAAVSSQALAGQKQPTQIVEVRVLNSDGTDAEGFSGEIVFDMGDDPLDLTVAVRGGRGRDQRSSISYVGPHRIFDRFPGSVFQENRTTECSINDGPIQRSSGDSTNFGTGTALLQVEEGEIILCVYTYTLKAALPAATTHQVTIIQRIEKFGTNDLLTTESGAFLFDVFGGPNSSLRSVAIEVDAPCG